MGQSIQPKSGAESFWKRRSIFSKTLGHNRSRFNDAVQWIQDELMFQRKPTWSGYNFGGMLVLVNLIVRKIFKQK
jgi:hypothetical protein